MQQISHLNGRPHQKEASFPFAVIFALTFAVFFVIAVTAQVLMLNWRSWFPGAENSRTITGGVRAAVYTLMSHLT
ncbi:MAG: hypothetical protein ACO2Z5_01330 [Burkholderiaceae bacterium]|jgi:light-harvesting complex 1 beta chain